MTSETSEITVTRAKVLPNVYPERDYELNLVDVPGLQDTRGAKYDQKTLDNMRNRMKVICPQINMFVLCFEKGKFD